jgi:Tfp pilus assembly protein PilF
VFRYLRKDLDEYEWFCDFLLDQAVRLNIPNESTNALSNWGVVKFEVGNFDEAQKKFEQALERSDQYAEAEASFYLAKIHKANGNKELADLYDAKCQAAGGYE